MRNIKERIWEICGGPL